MAKRKMPSFWQQVKNFTGAMYSAARVRSKCTKEQYEDRMTVCDGCEHRINNRCTACGCNIHLKGLMQTWTCDLGLWRDVDAKYEEIKGRSKSALPEPDVTHGKPKRAIVNDHGDVSIRAETLSVPDGYVQIDEHKDWKVYRHNTTPCDCRFRRMGTKIKGAELEVLPHCVIDGPAEVIDFSKCLGCPLAQPSPPVSPPPSP